MELLMVGNRGRRPTDTRLLVALFALLLALVAATAVTVRGGIASDGDVIGTPPSEDAQPVTTSTIAPTTTSPSSVVESTTVRSSSTTSVAPHVATSSTPAPTSTATSSVPPPPTAPVPNARPLEIREGRFLVDGVQRPLVGINASGAASRLALGSPCGGTDVDLDLMFSVLPERALVRVWFTQRMATGGEVPTRIWDAVDAVVDAAERAPTRPLLVLTLGVSAGYCDGGTWRDRAWYDGGYAAAPEPGMPSSYLGWVDEVTQRYASRPSVAVWEPMNEPDPSSCLPGYSAPCYGYTSCEDGAAESLSSFFAVVGDRIHANDPDGLVSTGGTGWCGWSSAQEIRVVESTPQIDIVGVHVYEENNVDLPQWITDAVERARSVGKPLLIGELGMASGPGMRTREARADALGRKMYAQLTAGADAVLLWVFGYGPASCSLCLMPDDPVYTPLRTLGEAIRGR